MISFPSNNLCLTQQKEKGHSLCFHSSGRLDTCLCREGPVQCARKTFPNELQSSLSLLSIHHVPQGFHQLSSFLRLRVFHSTFIARLFLEKEFEILCISLLFLHRKVKSVCEDTHWTHFRQFPTFAHSLRHTEVHKISTLKKENWFQVRINKTFY